MSGKFKKLFLLFVLFGVTLTLFAADWASVVSDYGPGIAKIIVKNDKGVFISQGTGFMIEVSPGETRMVTNAHVVSEAAHIQGVSILGQFLFPDSNEEQSCGLKIDVINKDLDLCLLIPDGDVPALLKLAAGEEPKLMEEVLVIGYPLDKNFKTTPGYLQAFQDIEGMGRMLDLSAVVAPGNSGGPVLNSAGRVIGIITAVIPGYNFNLAVPVRNLLSVIHDESGQQTIYVNSEPDGAWVFIDSDYKGKTPLTLNLLNREYQLNLEKEGFQVFSDRIGPWEESREDINIKLEKNVDSNPEIEIIVTPPNAEIVVNNKKLGTSPATVQLPTGSIMRIRVTAGGYREKLEFYEVTDEKTQKVNIELEAKFLFW